MKEAIADDAFYFYKYLFTSSIDQDIKVLTDSLQLRLIWCLPGIRVLCKN